MIAWVRKPCNGFFLLNILFNLPFSYVLEAFSGFFWSRAQNTIPKRVSTEGTRVVARRGVLISWHGFGLGCLQQTARILFRKLARISRGCFQPFLPCPKESTPDPRHPKSPNPRRFGILLSQLFLWRLVAGVLRGNTIRGNTTRNSERKMAL